MTSVFAHFKPAALTKPRATAVAVGALVALGGSMLVASAAEPAARPDRQAPRA
jgi:hypothetical protein